MLLVIKGKGCVMYSIFISLCDIKTSHSCITKSIILGVEHFLSGNKRPPTTKLTIFNLLHFSVKHQIPNCLTLHSMLLKESLMCVGACD